MEAADKDEAVVVVTERWLAGVLADRALFEDQNLVLADRLAALLLRVESSEHTNALLLRCIQDAFHKPRRRRLAHPPPTTTTSHQVRPEK